MEEHTIFTRIKHRIDTAENWAMASEIPLKGELLIYIEENNAQAKIKIGDGEHSASELPFVFEYKTITNSEIDAICSMY